jgi:hypothetical protein
MHIMEPERTPQVRFYIFGVTIGSMDKTSAQPQVKLTSTKIGPSVYLNFPEWRTSSLRDGSPSPSSPILFIAGQRPGS